jgi:hypothetical protein
MTEIPDQLPDREPVRGVAWQLVPLETESRSLASCLLLTYNRPTS